MDGGTIFIIVCSSILLFLTGISVGIKLSAWCDGEKGKKLTITAKDIVIN